MSEKNLRSDVNYAWPTAEIAVMGSKGAVAILYRKEKDKSNYEVEYNDKFRSPVAAAKKGYIDDIIEPRTTRMRIAQDLKFLLNKKQDNPYKKHGNIPL